MRNAILTSVALHIAAISLVVVGLPALFMPDPVEDVAIAVEIVTQMPTPKRKSEPVKPKVAKAKPPPPPKVKAPAQPPAKPEIVPAETAMSKPPPPKPKAAPPPEEKVAPEPRKVAQAPPPRRKPKPPPPQKDEFKSLLKNLAEQAELDRRKRPETKLEIAMNDPAPKARKMSQIDKARLTATLAGLVKQQITPCWNIPTGARDVHKMRIGIRIFLNPDGTLRGAPRLEDPNRVRSDPFYRAMAESAIRALHNPRCSPLKLPHDKYDIWKEISFNFDPREALEP